MRTKLVTVILLSVVLNATGQILFKLARDAWPDEPVIYLFLHVQTWLAVFVYSISSICWIWVVSRAPLSLAYPMLAFTFPIVVGLSALIFSETLFLTRLLGVGVIGVGVSLLART